MIPQISDFITIASLATKAFQALDSSRGSKFEFSSLLSTLKAVGQAMWQAKALCVEFYTPSSGSADKDPCHPETIAHGIVKECEECKALIIHFLKNFASYAEAFSERGAGKLHTGVKMLTWAGRRDEVEVLEKRLNERLQTLQIHLLTFSQYALYPALSR